jgi:hypothetical protein
VGIDANHQREAVEPYDPDRFGHAEILKKDPFQGHVRGSKRCTPPSKSEIYPAATELFAYRSSHTAFADQSPYATPDQETREIVHSC